MDNKKDDLNFDYKKILENENSLNNVLNTNEKNISKKEIVTEMIKGNISELVKNQLNINKRDDLQENSYTNNENHTSISEKTSWLEEYKKQTITITKDKIRAYLKNYKDLEKLIKYRKQKIKSGKIKAESKELDINNIENYNFLKESLVDKQTFLISTDYKIQEMEFYKKELMMILKYLKKYIFISYQFLVLKYYLKLTEEELKLATNIENTKYIDDVIIEYIYQKLCKEAKNNGRDKDDL